MYSNSKVFNAFNVFKVSSLYGIWSTDLLDPFSCQLHHIASDRLKSHIPLPCPGTQLINIPLKFHCVFFIFNFTIANTRYLMLSTFSRSVPSNVYEAWIFLIRFLVGCIILHLTGWNLIPHFLVQELNRSVYLWSYTMSSSSWISWSQTQSSAKSLFSDSIADEISLCTERITRDQERCPGGHPTKPEPSQILLHLQQLVVV